MDDRDEGWIAGWKAGWLAELGEDGQIGDRGVNGWLGWLANYLFFVSLFCFWGLVARLGIESRPWR